MRTLRSIAILAGAIVLAVSAMAQGVNKEPLPPPVQSAVEKLSPGATFQNTTKKIGKDGAVKYFVFVKQGDQRIRFIVSPEGKLYERLDMNPKFADLPLPVKKTIEEECSCEPKSLSKVSPGGKQPYYKFGINGTVEADGSLRTQVHDKVGHQVGVQPEDVPLPVLNTLKKLDPGTDWFAIKQDGSTYGTSYVIKEKGGKFFVISADGKLDESWDITLKVSDLPAPVKKIVEKVTFVDDDSTLMKVTPSGQKPYYRYTLNVLVAEDGSRIKEMQDESDDR